MFVAPSIARHNPMAGNPLRSRDDLADAVRAVIAPALPFLQDRPGRLALGSTACRWETDVAEFEGFARLFWGLAPLAAGGFAYPEAEAAMLAGLAAGTDPSSPSYWGEPGFDLRGGKDQRLCDMAAVGFALAMAPDTYWTPLGPEVQGRLAAWLLRCMDRPYNDNNWLYFRVLVALGLRRVGVPFDWAPVETHLLRLESFATAPGWYEDGGTGRYDHYIAFAMHFYGLLYATIAAKADPARAARLVERARVFAPDYAAWFADGGAGLPYGRSLIYRCAHAGYWGALAFAGCEALPWGVVKGLALRNIRYWSGLPIAARDGVLTLGYAFENPNMIEEYSGDGSPYWALKAFLPLALAPDHPFWTAEEVPHPMADGALAVQPDPKLVLFRHEGEVVALAGGQSVANSNPAIETFRNAAAKYAKFAYSTRHGFSIELDNRHPNHGAFDSMLALRSDGCPSWRVRNGNRTLALDGGDLVSVWHPWPDVRIETRLFAMPPWHVRIHTIDTPFPINSIEGGFAIDREGDRFYLPQDDSVCTGDRASAVYPADCGTILDLGGQRTPTLVYATAMTNLVSNRTAIPSLTYRLPVGRTVLACAVVTSSDATTHGRLVAAGPTLPPGFERHWKG